MVLRSYYLFVIVMWSDRKFNFSLLAANEPKWWFGLFVVLHVRKFNIVGIIYLDLLN